MIAWTILIIFLAIILAVLVAAIRLIVSPGPKAEPTEPKQPLTAGQLVGILVGVGVVVLIGMTVHNYQESTKAERGRRDARVDCYTEQLRDGGSIDPLGC